MEEIVIFLIGLLTSFIGVSIGGGGLIMTPALILLGVDPKIVVGTTTIAYMATSSIGFYKYHSHKQLDLKLSLYSIIPITIGSVLGARLLLEIPELLIKKVIGYFLIALLIISFLKSDIGMIKKKVGKLRKVFGHVCLFFIGLYKGTINSGTGILGSYNYIYNFGQTYLQSSGTRKLPWLISYIASSVIFIQNDLIDWKIAIILIVSNLIGGWYGAHHAINKGNVWMKFGFGLVVGFSALKLIF